MVMQMAIKHLFLKYQDNLTGYSVNNHSDIQRTSIFDIRIKIGLI